jgi:hypothetical protein
MSSSAGAGSRWSLRQLGLSLLTLTAVLVVFYYTVNTTPFSSDATALRSSSSSSSLSCLTSNIYHTTCLKPHEGVNSSLLLSPSTSSSASSSICSTQRTFLNLDKGREGDPSSCECGTALQAGDCVVIKNKIRCLPSFVIVGAMKSGTGALLRWLAMHPNLQAGRGKDGQNEVHFFGSQAQDLACLWRAYLAHFPAMSAREARGTMTFDKSPDYMRSAQKMAQISSLLPKAKIIMILRNPTSRAYSGEFDRAFDPSV